jgi:hypothetical protein
VPWEGRHAIYGTFGNPNFLAEYTAPLAVLSFAFFLGASRPGRRLGWLAVWTAFISVLVLTISRSAWLGLVSGLAVFLLVNGGLGPFRAQGGRNSATKGANGWLRGLVAGAAALVVVFLGWDQVSNRLAGSFSLDDPGIATRFHMWKVAARMAADHPVLGTGPGGYGLNYLEYSARTAEAGGQDRPKYAGITKEAHNDALQALAERGLLGGVVFLFILGWMSWKAVRGLGDGPERRRQAAALGALAAVMVECLFGFPMRVFPVAALAIWLASCAVPFQPAKIPGLFASVPVMLFSLAGLWQVSRGMVADSMMNYGLTATSGITYLEKGLKLQPTSGDIHFRTALRFIGAGKFDEAQVHLGLAMPGLKDPDIQFNLGWIALQKREYPASIKWFREGLRLYPYYRPGAWDDLARAYRGAGMKKEAGEAEAHILPALPEGGSSR